MKGGSGRSGRLGGWVALAVFWLVTTSTHAQTASPGVVAEVRVHGNHTTPDADVLAIAGEVAGKPSTDALVAEVTARLEKSGRFEGVDVRSSGMFLPIVHREDGYGFIFT